MGTPRSSCAFTLASRSCIWLILLPSLPHTPQVPKSRQRPAQPWPRVPIARPEWSRLQWRIWPATQPGGRPVWKGVGRTLAGRVLRLLTARCARGSTEPAPAWPTNGRVAHTLLIWCPPERPGAARLAVTTCSRTASALVGMLRIHCYSALQRARAHLFRNTFTHSVGRLSYLPVAAVQPASAGSVRLCHVRG